MLAEYIYKVSSAGTHEHGRIEREGGNGLVLLCKDH